MRGRGAAGTGRPSPVTTTGQSAERGSAGLAVSSALRKRFHAALARAGVRRVRFHDLRHSFGTAMAATGTPMRALMAMKGHASMQTTLRYADYSPDPSGGGVWAARAFGDERRGTERGTELSEHRGDPRGLRTALQRRFRLT